jgi:uncharacterized membrane protein
MLVLGLFVRFFSPKAILISGLVLIFGHNLFDLVKAAPGSGLDIFLGIFMTGAGRFVPRGDGGNIAFLYVILPWAGIMMSGYGLGAIYNRAFPEQKRRKILLQSGVAAIVMFLVLRFVNYYGDQSLWSPQSEGMRTFLSFMNASKYPPSLIFTLMTLGPILILLAFTEHTDNALTRFFTVYGAWGRPDMAPVLFSRAVLAGRSIDVFNHGKMRRDFTHVNDIVAGVLGALDAPSRETAPHRVFNLGNHTPVELEQFISVIESAAGHKAEKN